MAAPEQDLDDLLDSALDDFCPSAFATPSPEAPPPPPARPFDPLGAAAKAASPAPASGSGKAPAFDPLGMRKPKSKGKKAAASAMRPLPAGLGAGLGGGMGGGVAGEDEFAAGLSKMLEGLAGGGEAGELDKLLGGSLEELMTNLGLGGAGAGGGTGGEDQLAATLAALAGGASPHAPAPGAQGPVPPPDFPAFPGAGAGAPGAGADDLMKAFAGLGEGGDNEMQSMMDQMMQHLLSKDVLYEPMREIRDKYPAWLEENQGTLEPAEHERYTKQLGYITQLCSVYENDPKNFTSIVELMQQMQGCGQPPEAIVRELAPGMQIGPDGSPSFPGLSGMPGGEQCAIM